MKKEQEELCLVAYDLEVNEDGELKDNHVAVGSTTWTGAPAASIRVASNSMKPPSSRPAAL